MTGQPSRETWIRVAVIVAGILLVSAGHYLTPASLFLWHNLFQRLYYLPIVFSAITFGWVGGVVVAVVCALSYVPHIVMAWGHNPDYTANQYAEIVVFVLVGGVTGVLADRERKRREQLQKTAEELSRVYRELQDSFEQLKRADRLSAVGQLSAGLAHEIRNPLASIEGAVDILERNEGADTRGGEFFAIIKKECQRLNGLLTSLLDFARPRQPRIKSMDVREVIESVVQLTGHTGERKGTSIEVRVPDGTPQIQGDPEQLQQVILNLTLNAIQAMPEGGRIVLEAEQQGSEFVIQVIDEGDGMDDANLDKIFDPFYTTKQSGTGLGLAVAHQIVDQHGGILKATANKEKGMTFSVVLPLQRSLAQ